MFKTSKIWVFPATRWTKLSNTAGASAVALLVGFSSTTVSASEQGSYTAGIASQPDLGVQFVGHTAQQDGVSYQTQEQKVHKSGRLGTYSAYLEATQANETATLAVSPVTHVEHETGSHTGFDYGTTQHEAVERKDGLLINVGATTNAFAQAKQDIVVPTIDLDFSGVAEAVIIENELGLQTNTVAIVPSGDASKAAISLDAAIGGKGRAIAEFADGKGNVKKIDYDHQDLSKLGLKLGQSTTRFYAQSNAFAEVAYQIGGDAVTHPNAYGHHDHVDLAYAKPSLIGIRGGVEFDNSSGNDVTFQGAAFYNSEYLDVEFGNTTSLAAPFYDHTAVGLVKQTDALLPYGDGFDLVKRNSTYSLSARAKYAPEAYPVSFELAGQINTDKAWSLSAATSFSKLYNENLVSVSASAFLDSSKAYGARLDASFRNKSDLHGLLWASAFKDGDAEQILQAGLGGGYGGFSLLADWTRYSTDRIAVDYKFSGGGLYSLVHQSNTPQFHVDSIGLKAAYQYSDKASIEVGTARETSDLFGTRNVLTTKLAIKL